MTWMKKIAILKDYKNISFKKEIISKISTKIKKKYYDHELLFINYY